MGHLYQSLVTSSGKMKEEGVGRKLEPEAWEECHDAANFWAYHGRHELTVALVTHTRSSRQAWLTLQQKCYLDSVGYRKSQNQKWIGCEGGKVVCWEMSRWSGRGRRGWRWSSYIVYMDEVIKEQIKDILKIYHLKLKLRSCKKFNCELMLS